MLSLPIPPAELLAQSNTLRDSIVRDIRERGLMSFMQYMERCLYEPGLGYYSGCLAKFSGASDSVKRRGDFTTAPELGFVFAHTLAHVIAPAIRSVEAGVFLEIGAGSGAFACDLLDALKRMDALPSAYWILERSADLRARQQNALRRRHPEFIPQIRWLDAPPERLWQGVMFANEVMDALPCMRFKIAEDGPQVLAVGIDAHGQLCDHIGADLPPELQLACFSELPLGYESELQPQLSAWLSGLTESMQEGIVLLVDYGYPRQEYYLPERTRGTLVCHYQHQMFDAPYVWPGLVDLSCSVDFTAVAEAGAAAGLSLRSYLPQAQLLIAAGLDRVLHENNWESLSQMPRSRLSAEVRKLTLPGEMGERMQAMLWTKNHDVSELHEIFAMLDWRHRL